MQVWLDNGLVAEETAAISIRNHGYLVGDGFFETALVRNGQMVARNLHFQRMAHSAKAMGMSLPNQLVRGLDAVIAPLATESDWRLRITITSGVGPAGVERGGQESTLLITAAPLAAPQATLRVLLTDWQRNANSPIAGAKSTSYAENVVAMSAAREAGAQEALFLGSDASIAEGATSNLFVAVGGNWITPPATTGLLCGTARARILHWFDAQIAPVTLADLMNADAAVLTSAISGVRVIEQVAHENRIVNLPTSFGHSLAAEYAQRVQIDPNPVMTWRAR